MRMAHPSASLMPREVTGEILRDAGGRLYERIGDHVRPVHQLFTGARGEMVDLTPVREVTRENGASNASTQGQHQASTAVVRAIRVEGRWRRRQR